MNSFISVMTSRDGKGTIHVFPDFSSRGKDIMIKSGKFYAIYDEKSGFWCTDQDTATDIIDEKLIEYAESKYENVNGAYMTSVKEPDGTVVKKSVTIDFLYKSRTKQLKAFKEWLSVLPPFHNYHPLDSEITQAGFQPSLKDYRSKKLSYNIEPGPIDNYDLLMSTCYGVEEREKLEWAVGSIFCGDSKKLQKFIAIYGKPGTGKSTFFNIVQELFEGYWAVIDVDALVSRNNQFATAAFKDNPLVCIQHDADLSKIEKNDVLNSIVSHEKINLNEKYKEQYALKLNAMIFIGTNETISINDTKQGITRRMIDVYPTGMVLPQNVYDKVKAGIAFELGAIAAHCVEVYKNVDPMKYQKYKPLTMIKKTNVYTNFISERYFDLCEPCNDPITVKDLYKMFKVYMEESGYTYVPTIAKFKEVMMDFYDDFKERDRVDGRQLRSVFSGFKKDCLDDVMSCVTNKESTVDDGHAVNKPRFVLEECGSTEEIRNNPLQKALNDELAQYSNKHGIPSVGWDSCKTRLNALDPTREHYVKCPVKLICIDFDLKDADGNKDFEKNLEAIQKWPLTYAETSKSGAGIHLHYWYDGDPLMLSRLYDENIEVKVYTGGQALRRRLTKCNKAPIATISSGLPLREEPKMLNNATLQNEKALRTVIIKNLNKEYHPATKPSIDFIYKVLDDAYRSGIHYDVSDLENRILSFANNSTHNAKYCLGVVGKMKFQSDDVSESVEAVNDTVIFVDCEVFPNVLIVCWQEDNDDAPMHTMINPRPNEVEELFKFKIVGFNNRGYDNHILYARTMGYSNLGLFDLSQRLIEGDQVSRLKASFSEAYNLSYADVYDFAKKKQSLKAWEIELGIRHLENQYPWDEDLPEDKWEEVGEYCANDTRATRALFHHLKADFTVREILADLTGLTLNHTTRQHSTKFMFGDDKHPELVYTDLSKTFPGYKYDAHGIDPSEYKGYDPNDKKTWHLGGKSIYRGVDPSEGGKVLVKEGIWFNVGLLDIASMHPSTMIALNYFGKYSKRFEDLVRLRLAIKHGDFEEARTAFEGKLAKWLTNEDMANQLADALKLVINSIYGYTTADFENPFRDSRNVDNIVAKRGALFMILLTDTLDEKGIPWIHVKTDSIKIPNITPEVVTFVQEFGRKYGYEFELESVYEKMCIVNGSTYVAYVKSGKHAGEWVTVAAQFQHPYVKKTLFTKEPLIYKDYCEVKSVTSSMVLDYNEKLPEGEHNYEFVGRIGSYIPVKPGEGGGILLRDKGKQYVKEHAAWEENPFDSKGKPKPEPKRYASIGGADGYRWIDSELFKDADEKVWKAKLDMKYYQRLVDNAIAAVNKYGDYEQFMSYTSEEYPPDEESPYDVA